jgi:hypothetical protein
LSTVIIFNVFSQVFATESPVKLRKNGKAVHPKETTPLLTLSSSTGETTPNFRKIRENGLWFADNTQYIEKLAANLRKNPGLVFFRPPGFGKSLFLSTLNAFYDINTTKKQYNKWFGGLYIKDKGIALQARCYHVLHLSLNFEFGSPTDMCQAFHETIRQQVKTAFLDYGMPRNEAKELLKDACPATCLEKFDIFVSKKKGRVLVLIDDYDRSMNEILIKNIQEYEDFASSFLSFFVRIKALQGRSNLKYLVTGIAPVFHDDVAGWNNYVDISSRPEFAEMLGINKTHLQKALIKLGITNKTEYEKYMDILKMNCGGYFFFGAKESLYNPVLCCNILSKLANKVVIQRILNDKVQPGDHFTTASFNNTINSITKRFPEAAIFTNALNEGNNSFIIDWVAYRITFSDLTDPRRGANPEVCRRNYKTAMSFLFYHGVLSLSKSDKCSPMILKVPNQMMYNQLMQRITSLK